MDVKILASGSNGNCYRISNKNTSLLVEAGISIKEIRKKLNFNLSGIDAALISHEHSDHAKAVNDLIKFGVSVYASEGTAEALKLKTINTFKRYSNSKDSYYPVRIGSFLIHPFETVHDSIEPLGFEILDESKLLSESLVFLTDTAYSKFTFNLEYLMLEINFIKSNLDENTLGRELDVNLRNRILKNHMSLEIALDFLKACNLSKLKKIWVMHLSEKNSDEKIIKEEIQKLTGVSVEIC